MSLLALILIVGVATAQNKQKSKQKEEAPTQKEMETMMKEMQSAMDEMSPEEKRAMDSMGIKMPSANMIPQVTDAQLKQAYENENRIVPLKDPGRITLASATIPNGGMSAYINKTHQAVLMKLSPATKSKGAEITQQVTRMKASAANSAVGLWIGGRPTLALYVMGEACKADPSNGNNLNNYAAFLTMCGAEQLALPILKNLNKRYPRNSSILNNMTQAWFGLGDLVNAAKYADSTIRINPYHPQANIAKALIEESKGNLPSAIALMKKSIHKGYSVEKENKLKKLGYDLKGDDITWDRPMPKDALGLEKFGWPAYPLTVEQNKPSEKEWNDFKNLCQQKIYELEAAQKRAEQEYTTKSAARTQQLLQAGQKGQYVQPTPGYTAKAVAKLGPGINDVRGNSAFVFAKELEQVTKALTAVEGYEKTLESKQSAIDKKYEGKIGEGRENPLEAICKDENTIRTQFLTDANGGLQRAYTNYLNYVRRRTNDLLYYYQYTQWPEQFELTKITAQLSWLRQIKDQRVFFKDRSSWCVAVPEKKYPGKLQNFDDVACQYNSTMNLGIYKITSSCSNLTGEFDFGGVNINLKDNSETGRFSGSAMVGASKGFDGPAGTELEASIAALVEFDNTGITDVGAIAGVSANAGNVTMAGADLKVTVNSGASMSGKGILQGIQ